MKNIVGTAWLILDDPSEAAKGFRTARQQVILLCALGLLGVIPGIAVSVILTLLGHDLRIVSWFPLCGMALTLVGGLSVTLPRTIWEIFGWFDDADPGLAFLLAAVLLPTGFWNIHPPANNIDVWQGVFIFIVIAGLLAAGFRLVWAAFNRPLVFWPVALAISTYLTCVYPENNVLTQILPLRAAATEIPQIQASVILLVIWAVRTVSPLVCIRSVEHVAKKRHWGYVDLGEQALLLRRQMLIAYGAIAVGFVVFVALFGLPSHTYPALAATLLAAIVVETDRYYPVYAFDIVGVVLATGTIGATILFTANRSYIAAALLSILTLWALSSSERSGHVSQVAALLPHLLVGFSCCTYLILKNHPYAAGGILLSIALGSAAAIIRTGIKTHVAWDLPFICAVTATAYLVTNQHPYYAVIIIVLSSMIGSPGIGPRRPHNAPPLLVFWGFPLPWIAGTVVAAYFASQGHIGWSIACTVLAFAASTIHAFDDELRSMPGGTISFTEWILLPISGAIIVFYLVTTRHFLPAVLTLLLGAHATIVLRKIIHSEAKAR